MNLNYRAARQYDLNVMIQMLADDALGQKREDVSEPINPRYVEAFKQINDDQNNELIVVEYDEQIIGMLQLTFITYLTHQGSSRCLIEGVRIHADYRGKGLGTQFFDWAIQHAKQKGCSMLQLTSDKQRPDAIRFYESLGFVASHEGFKLKL